MFQKKYKRDDKLQNESNKEAEKKQLYHQVKRINISILQARKYYLLIKWNDKKSQGTYSPLGKTFSKQMKTIKGQRKKHVETLKPSGEKLKIKATNEIEKIQ